MDIIEVEGTMDEQEAKQLFERLLKQKEIKIETGIKTPIPEELIKEFRELTKLSIRKIASITGLNKDKVNQILKSFK